MVVCLIFFGGRPGPLRCGTPWSSRSNSGTGRLRLLRSTPPNACKPPYTSTKCGGGKRRVLASPPAQRGARRLGRVRSGRSAHLDCHRYAHPLGSLRRRRREEDREARHENSLGTIFPIYSNLSTYLTKKNGAKNPREIARDKKSHAQKIGPKGSFRMPQFLPLTPVAVRVQHLKA